MKKLFTFFLFLSACGTDRPPLVNGGEVRTLVYEINQKSIHYNGVSFDSEAVVILNENLSQYTTPCQCAGESLIEAPTDFWLSADRPSKMACIMRGLAECRYELPRSMATLVDGQTGKTIPASIMGIDLKTIGQYLSRYEALYFRSMYPF